MSEKKDNDDVTTTEDVYDRSLRRETDQDYLKSAHDFAMRVVAKQRAREAAKAKETT
jgi:hypothetical protein